MIYYIVFSYLFGLGYIGRMAADEHQSYIDGLIRWILSPILLPLYLGFDVRGFLKNARQ